jgi:hypothetical protein
MLGGWVFRRSRGPFGWFEKIRLPGQVAVYNNWAGGTTRLPALESYKVGDHSGRAPVRGGGMECEGKGCGRWVARARGGVNRQA